MRIFRSALCLSLALVVLLGGCKRASTPAVPGKVAAIEPPLSYELRQGQDVYRHYCQLCHGDAGAGDGFNSFNLDPRPRDLSDPAFQKKKSDADFADAIRRGGAGVGLSSLMPPWNHTLSDRQIAGLVSYLRTLRRKPEAPGS